MAQIWHEVVHSRGSLLSVFVWFNLSKLVCFLWNCVAFWEKKVPFEHWESQTASTGMINLVDCFGILQLRWANILAWTAQIWHEVFKSGGSWLSVFVWFNLSKLVCFLWTVLLSEKRKFPSSIWKIKTTDISNLVDHIVISQLRWANILAWMAQIWHEVFKSVGSWLSVFVWFNLSKRVCFLLYSCRFLGKESSLWALRKSRLQAWLT